MLNITQLFVFFFFIAEGLEITCSLIQPSGRLFRLLAIKYLFLVLFGWIWVKEGIILNRKMVILSLLSALTILYFEYVAVYFHMDNEPWFFNTAWTFHRWPCYYFCANGLVYLLYIIWQRFKKNKMGKGVYQRVGKIFIRNIPCANVCLLC